MNIFAAYECTLIIVYTWVLQNVAKSVNKKKVTGNAFITPAGLTSLCMVNNHWLSTVKHVALANLYIHRKKVASEYK